MAGYAAIIDNGKTSAEGFYKAISQLIGNYGVAPTPPMTSLPTTAAPSTASTSLQAVQHAGGANMSVDISIGAGVIPNSLGTYAYSVWLDAVANVPIAAASPSNPRIDAIVAYINLSAVSTTNSNNPGALTFMDVQGTPGSSPAAPTSSQIQAAVGVGVPWMPVCTAYVAQNATQVVSANITDMRIPFAVHANLWGGSSNTYGHTVPNVADDTVALLNAQQTFTNKTFGSGSSLIWDGWQPPAGTFTYAGNNGNREFLLGTSTDLTAVIQKGDKLKVVRGTPPPTQCMSFNGTTQYASIASPSNMTFTGAFTIEAWIYMTAYQLAIVAGRLDATAVNGFWLNVSSSGQPGIAFAGGSSSTTISTYQSIPLNRWVHVAGVVTSESSKTAQVYINGVAVPMQAASGPNTALAQGSGPFVIGAWAANSAQYFPGYVSEVRVWQTALSQATIQANMAISIAAQSNLVVAIPGSGTFNDISGNGNNLTATNGALATQAANPYNATEYGFVTAVTSSQITVFCGAQCAIPNQAFGAVTYSRDRSPYGFPVSNENWIVDALFIGAIVQSNPGQNTWYNLAGMQLSVPTGPWRLIAEAQLQSTRGSSGTVTVSGAFSTASNSATEMRTVKSLVQAGSSVNTAGGIYTSEPLSLAAQTIYYFNVSTNQSGAATVAVNDDNGTSILRAEIGYI